MTDTRHAMDVAIGSYGIAPEGHRLPAETRLGPVRLQVTDVERSLDYYQEVLGFRLAHREDGGATLTAGQDARPLVKLRQRTGAASAPAGGRPGLYHFAILLPTRGDLGRFLRHLAERGKQAGAADHLVSEAAYLRDPDGLGIEVYADRPRSAWKTKGRELVMETDPLDVGSLLHSAGDSPWDGMPSGTKIGHVHLHVGDLQRAAKFYHRGLGLDKVVWSYPGALFLSTGGYHHHLALNTWAAEAMPAGDDEAKLLEWTLELPDVQSVAATAESLEAAGYSVERDAAGDFSSRDPWGTPLRVRMKQSGRG
ncbi:MAG TPA: VOC family protein [Gemmatimonadota bacterium]|nr:VOC family protein [Gemmatimonadota bacterium]